MKICHVITRLIIGGAQENTVLTCKGLVERGHDVALVAGPETGPEGSLWDDAKATGASLIPLDSMRRAVRPLLDLRATRELTAIFRKIRPDVVHTHSSKAGIIARYAAHRARVPIIIHTIHGMSFNRTQSASTRILYRILERRAARHTTAFVTVADAMIDQAVAAGLASRDRFTTIRSGLRTEFFRADSEQRARRRNEWNIADNEIVVGTVARLFENKGYEEIIEALSEAIRRMPRLRFIWVGDGLHRGDYIRRLTQLGILDRVRFTGLVPPGDIPSILNGFDILVHASRWEGLPRAVVQALLCEVPVVSFDNDGAPEVVRTNETGILVPAGNIRELANAIVRLSTEPELRRKFGQAGRARCLSEFDWRKMVMEIESLYSQLQSRQF